MDLFDDLQDGSGRDFFFALESAPGGLTPTRLTLTITGLQPSLFDQVTVFRSPERATLTINGLSFAPDYIVTPAPAALASAGQIPGELRTVVVTPSLPEPSYDTLPENPPTIAFITTVTPDTGLVRTSSLQLNATPGGNIAFLNIGVGQVSLSGYIPNLIFFEAETGLAIMEGREPTILGELIQSVGATIDDIPLRVVGLQPTLSIPFTWIDVDPQPPTSWTTTTRAA